MQRLISFMTHIAKVFRLRCESSHATLMQNVSTVLTISAGPHSLTEAQHIYYWLVDAGRNSAYDGPVIRRTCMIHLSIHHQTTLKTNSTADHSVKPGTGPNKVGVPRPTEWALASVGPLYIYCYTYTYVLLVKFQPKLLALTATNSPLDLHGFWTMFL